MGKRFSIFCLLFFKITTVNFWNLNLSFHWLFHIFKNRYNRIANIQNDAAVQMNKEFDKQLEVLMNNNDLDVESKLRETKEHSPLLFEQLHEKLREHYEYSIQDKKGKSEDFYFLLKLHTLFGFVQIIEKSQNFQRSKYFVFKNLNLTYSFL